MTHRNIPLLEIRVNEPRQRGWFISRVTILEGGLRKLRKNTILRRADSTLKNRKKDFFPIH